MKKDVKPQNPIERTTFLVYNNLREGLIRSFYDMLHLKTQEKGGWQEGKSERFEKSFTPPDLYVR